MKTRPRHLITALAALAGLSGPSAANMLPFNAAPAATVAVSGAAAKTTQSPRRQRLPFFNFETPKNPYRGSLFKHGNLNQRQRRKYNRSRHAAGFKNAFA